MMESQLELFADESTQRYAVVFCSCLMEDQFGQVWYRKELYKSNLIEDAAKNLTASLNQQLDTSRHFYQTIPEDGPYFLIP
jgi:hypothetical protein